MFARSGTNCLAQPMVSFPLQPLSVLLRALFHPVSCFYFACLLLFFCVFCTTLRYVISITSSIIQNTLTILTVDNHLQFENEKENNASKVKHEIGSYS